MPTNDKAYQKIYNAAYEKSHRRVNASFSLEAYRALEEDAKALNISIGRLVVLRAQDRRRGIGQAARPLNPHDPFIEEFMGFIESVSQSVNALAHKANIERRFPDDAAALQFIPRLAHGVEGFSRHSELEALSSPINPEDPIAKKVRNLFENVNSNLMQIAKYSGLFARVLHQKETIVKVRELKKRSLLLLERTHR